MNGITDEMREVPERILALPMAGGHAIPWYAGSDDSGLRVSPDGRDYVPDLGRYHEAIRSLKCYACGQKLGRHVAFVLSAGWLMRGMTQQPPCHTDCAVWLADWVTRDLEDAPADLEVLEFSPQLRAVWPTLNGSEGYVLESNTRAKLLWYDLFPGDATVQVRWRGPAATNKDEIRAALLTGATDLAEECGPAGVESERARALEAIERRLVRFLGEL